MITNHASYLYAKKVVRAKNNKYPKYVILQCKEFINICENKNAKYKIDEKKLLLIDKLLSLMIMAKGLKAGTTVRDCLHGFQWLLIVAVLCTVYRNNDEKRRYETAVFEIARKNGKTFIVGVLFILLFFTEPKFSKFYSVAPDGSLSREVKNQIHEIINSSPALCGEYQGKLKFKLLRDSVKCNLTETEYIPLSYSTSRLDGKLPNVFLADEVGALPNAYPIEAMRSGQLTILNKLGFVISTKYPTIQNPFEDEVSYCKKVLNGDVVDESYFSLLYEPDNTQDWATDIHILEQANPLAVEIPEIWDDLIKKRQQAVEMPTRRENFITKHCNIIYSGVGSENYIDINDLKKCCVKRPINWTGRTVYIGVDLSMSNDNCSVAMATYDHDKNKVYIKAIAFIPQDKILEKNKFEKLNYNDFISDGTCIACGGKTIDYSVIEQYILELEQNTGCKIHSVGFDRYNAISTAQKLENAGLVAVEVRQHSSVLHPPTKWLSELIANKQLAYNPNKLLEINFNNAKCTYDTNLNRYVSKKKSNGKIDEVASILNALYLLQQTEVLDEGLEWCVQ